MRLLLLAGTREARALSFALDETRLVSSLAGVTQRPAELGGRLRTGGFGGVEGLTGFLKQNRIRAMIDATHPFAAQMSRNAAAAATRAGVPVLRLLRPAWDVRDSWTRVADLPAAAVGLQSGDRAFLATGRGSLDAFLHRTDAHLTVRVIDDIPGEFPTPHGAFLVSRPPFTEAQEVETLRHLGTTVVVARNSGGSGGIEKLEAADRLGLRVLMVDRPALPEVPTVPDVEAALAYVEGQGWLDD